MAVEKKAAVGKAPAVSKVQAETADEIDEIMSEIQSLQQTMAEVPKAKAATVPKLKAVPDVAPDPVEPEVETGAEEFRGSGDDASMEETLGAMKGEPHEGGLLSEATETDENVQEQEEVAEAEAPAAEAEAEEVVAEQVEEEEGEEIMAKNYEQGGGGGNSEGNLTMTLSGSMTMRLKYECDGQEVTVGFANGALKVQLADGTEFKIPVARGGGKLRSAA
jgi:hypothetical protein